MTDILSNIGLIKFIIAHIRYEYLILCFFQFSIQRSKIAAYIVFLCSETFE